MLRGSLLVLVTLGGGELLQAVQALLERDVALIDLEADEEGEEQFVVLKETHADVAEEDLAELILEHDCTLLHLLQSLLLA